MPEEQKKKKKHKLKKPKEIAHIDGNFRLVCADLSLRCPGFSKLEYNAATKSATIIRKSCVNNIGDTKKPHGQLLYEIGQEFISYLEDTTFFLCVRERGVSKFAAETQCLFRVVGLRI
jgi:3-methyladenine DNA glycosylase AlkC